MNHIMLVAILGVMSIVVALESIWLGKKSKTDSYLGRFSKEPVATALRTIYFVGFPFIALISGLLPARLFGLKGLEALTPVDLSHSGAEAATATLTQFGNVLLTWIPDFGITAAISALLGGFFLLYLWLVLTTLKSANKQFTGRIYQSSVDLFFDGVHWAFYRAVAWLMLGTLYLGVVGGLAMILLEYVLTSRLGNFSTALQQQLVFRFMLGIMTSVVFLFAPNLWLALALQYILVICSESLLRTWSRFKGIPLCTQA